MHAWLNLWTKILSARRRITRRHRNGNECKNALINRWWLQLLKRQRLARFCRSPLVRDREVGGSNPLAPTKKIKFFLYTVIARRYT